MDVHSNTSSVFSQCYFNNDALFEAVTYDIQTVVDEWGSEHTEKLNYRVVNQDGEVLYTFETPKDCIYAISIIFRKVSKDFIIVRIPFENEKDRSTCMCYYSIKVGQTGSLAPIRQMHEMKLDHNLVANGDVLVVTVSEDPLHSSVIVTTLSGVAVKEVPVVDGQTIIGTSDLPSGLYVVSQNGGASAKFVVK